MGAALSSATTFLSVTLCDGSSRKLIAGWWYVFEIIVIDEERRLRRHDSSVLPLLVREFWTYLPPGPINVIFISARILLRRVFYSIDLVPGNSSQDGEVILVIGFLCFFSCHDASVKNSIPVSFFCGIRQMAIFCNNNIVLISY